ncbi:MAG: hypothetical protein FJW97_05495 [Actinobacteria bacterium]|nr:hypothetical protein [Actinomycetota bacterium]
MGDDIGDGLSEREGRGLGVRAGVGVRLGVGLGATLGEGDTSGVGAGDVLGDGASVSGDTAPPGVASRPCAIRAATAQAAIQVNFVRMPTPSYGPSVV